MHKVSLIYTAVISKSKQEILWEIVMVPRTIKWNNARVFRKANNNNYDKVQYIPVIIFISYSKHAYKPSYYGQVRNLRESSWDKFPTLKYELYQSNIA